MGRGEAEFNSNCLNWGSFVEKVAFDHNLKNRRSFMKEDRVEGIL